MERNGLEGLDVEETIILKWVFKNGNGRWTRLIWLRIRTVEGCL
jgi:hypothetical protein